MRQANEDRKEARRKARDFTNSRQQRETQLSHSPLTKNVPDTSRTRTEWKPMVEPSGREPPTSGDKAAWNIRKINLFT